MKTKQYSPTQLSGYLGCKHQANLEMGARKQFFERPIRTNRIVENLQKKGQEFEDRYVELLRAEGKTVADISDFEGQNAQARTVAAMESGADVIVQAVLGNDNWWGRADFLLRVEGRSKLGNYSYEVADTKLARVTKGGSILQLCIYNYLLKPILGLQPEWMYIIRPDANNETRPYEKVPYRLADFQSYFRLIREDFETAMDLASEMTLPSATEERKPAHLLMDELETTPEPTAHCDVCAWWIECNAKRRTDDYLHFIAGIRANQIEELRRNGVTTLTDFVQNGPALFPAMEGNVAGFERIHNQAVLQLAHRENGGLPPVEWFDPEAKRGLNLLPPPSKGDIFFDLEGDHFADGGPFEYLWGYCYLDAGELKYKGQWVYNRAQERAAFEEFMDFVSQRIVDYPGMRIYHFAPYEPGALKRLVGRYSSRNTEMDELLRAKRLVDLYTVVRQSFAAGIERYSIKELEQFYEYEREQDLEAAKLSRWAVERAIENKDEMPAEDREIVELYNTDDCRSTYVLRNWLEKQRETFEQQGAVLERPEPGNPEASERIAAAEARRIEIFQQLTADLPDDRQDWSPENQARNLLAHMLGFFTREFNVACWEYYRLMELEPEDQLRERKVVVGLRYLESYKEGRSQVDVYGFPKQEVAIGIGKALKQVTGGVYREGKDHPDIGSLHLIDFSTQRIHIKRNGKTLGFHPEVIAQSELISIDGLRDSLATFAESILEHRLTGEGPFRAGRALLLKQAPKLDAGVEMLPEPENTTLYCEQVVCGLDHSVLAIQGPPGTGKTYNGAHMIIALVEAGMRVGITAVSHKVIQNLLLKVRDVAASKRIDIKLAQKSDAEAEGILSVNNERALASLDDGFVVGSTTWLWASDKSVDALDYLFVDEAGQMSLANVLACSRSARNLVLLGDPQQLQQPQRGVHPDGSEVAALVHMLDGRQTIAWDRGIFLETTYRLHPSICDFNSQLYYEGRLRSFGKLVRQQLTGPGPFSGSGLFYVPADHYGNQSSSRQEVDIVAQLVRHLTDGKTRFIDHHQGVRQLAAEDIKIIAPYNAQVAALKSALPELQIGTVDKFQGQEAPVIIYSMASSTAEDAPRGMSFLYDPHRLNVAVSRARSTFILVAAPALKFPDCKTPEQMKWANGLCRFFELSREIPVDVLALTDA